jgi:hypothetical protein
MNPAKDAIINIQSTLNANGSCDVKRTIIGSGAAIVLALVATMQLEKDFAECVIAAVKTYNDPAMPNLKKRS